MEASVCIEQKGTVEEVKGHSIKVKIHRESSCNHCNARSMCYMGEGNERILDITDYTPDLQIGDTVSITISRKMGNRAVLLGYLVPFLILITALLILNHFGIREWLSGLIAISLLIPYFFIIYLLRDILRKKFSISARK